MKTSLLTFGLLLAGCALTTSCNKDLKNDIQELQGRVNEVESILGANEPITATSTFTDNANATRTVTGTYKFKAGNNGTQKMVNNGNGTFDVYIERFSDVDWYEGAWISFTYNPTSKAITNKKGGHYWGDEDSYGNQTRYDATKPNGLTLDITVDKIDVTTGDISLKFAASGTSQYTSEAPATWSPNPGKPMSTTFDFTGKLKVFTKN